MKILVTGATGFIGNYVINKLINTEHTIYVTSRSREQAKEFDWFPKVNYKEFQLENFDTSIDYFTFFSQPDVLIHLAWEGLPNYKQDFHIQINYPRHLYFLKNLIYNGLKNLTVAGTCLEYGLQEGCLEESMPVFPNIPYAIAKNKLRMALEKICINQGINLNWCRLFYVYGEGQNSNSLLSQLKNSLLQKEPMFNMSGGMQIRDFIHVDIVARKLCDLALKNYNLGIVNICSGIPVTVKDFVLKYLANTNQNIKLNLGFYPYTDYEPMSFWGNTSKFNGILS